jgi:integrase
MKKTFFYAKSAGVKYKSPHKLRHGHAVYALKLKAISQNLMHSTIGIMDGIIGVLVGDDVHNTIVDRATLQDKSNGKIENLLSAVLNKLNNRDSK